LAPGALSHRETILEEERHERTGDQFFTDQGEIQRALSIMVPPELFDYFFFEGETLANHLVGGKDTKGIREGLATLIHEHEWEAAVGTVQSVQEHAGRDLRKVAEANKEYQQVVDRFQDIETQLQQQRQKRTSHEESLEEKKKRYDECEEQIHDLSRGKSFELLNEKLSKARSELKAKEREFETIESEISRGIGSSFGLPLLTHAFDPALAQLQAMRDQNLLPADVSEGFVNRLLESKTCVCGRSLDPKLHSEERNFIEAYRERTMAVDLNAALLDLLNALEKKTKRGFRTRADDSSSALSERLDKRDSTIVAIADLRTRIKGLEDERQRLNVEAIQRLQSEQRKAAEAQREATRNITTADQQIRILEHQRSQLDTEMKGLKRSGAATQILALHSIQKRAGELVDFINEARSAVRAAFHSQLQSFVSQYYDSVAPDGSTAWVDPHSLLPAIRVDGEVRKNIGGAQRQLLVLSHIVSLAELRKWLHDQLQDLGISPGRIDDHCFVLDSVFGPTADQFREKCAEFLVGKARQIIVLVASQQWDEVVRTRLEKSANKVYRLVRHTPKKDINPAERTMTFRRKAYEVFRNLPDGERAYTTAEEIYL
jgi:predicted nuclease with TOPRIM domain